MTDAAKLDATIRDRISNPDGWHSSPQSDAALAALDELLAEVARLREALERVSESALVEHHVPSIHRLARSVLAAVSGRP